MINMKERCGYAYVSTKDKKEQDFLFEYCESRSIIWNMFLGWRKTTIDDFMYFWIPKKVLEEVSK